MTRTELRRPAGNSAGASDRREACDARPEAFLLAANGWAPNNPKLPVLVYRKVTAAKPGEPAAAEFEAMFERNGWTPKWRNGVYGYHHYHSTAHEALGFAGGSARLELGGEGGQQVEVTSGDAIVLPVGTAHRRIEASPDFLVVGAYPPGPDWDVCRKAATPAMLVNMDALPVPECDPVVGPDGPLRWLWVR